MCARAARQKKIVFFRKPIFSLFWLIERARAAHGSARALLKIKILNSVDQGEQITSQVAQNRVKVATDGNIFEDRTFFEVPLKNFLLTS